MRRRGFITAIVAAAAGCLALVPKVLLSTRAGTLKPAWTDEQQKAWDAAAAENSKGLEEFMERDTVKSILIQVRQSTERKYGLSRILPY